MNAGWLVRQLIVAAVLLVLAGAVAPAGYCALGGDGVSGWQAAYIAHLTLLGYGEVTDTSQNLTPRVFNIAVLLAGLAWRVYVFATVAAFVMLRRLQSGEPDTPEVRPHAAHLRLLGKR